MKRLLVIAIIVAVAASLFLFIKTELKTNLELNSKIAAIHDRIDEIRVGIIDSFKDPKKRLLALFSKKSLIDDGADDAPVAAITIYLRHGGVISGRLLSRDDHSYTVDWGGQKYEVQLSQIDRVEHKTQRDVEWPYKSDVVAVKTNGIVLDGEIKAVDGQTVTFSFPEGGGSMEMGVKRSEIDHLLFAPVYNKASQDVEMHIASLFPKMKVYREGNVTIYTDSYPTTVKSYMKTARSAYTEIYLKFFTLFKGRRPLMQNFIVAFDDFKDYVEFAATDGVPGWAAIGYFSPLDKTLYIFNAFGERMEKMVFDVIIGKTGKSFDQIVGAVKQGVDSRYHIFIDGQAKVITDKFWDTYSLYKGELTSMTTSTLRHEFAHEVFHNWGFQSIVLSKPAVDKKKLMEKKKEFLDAKDYRKKEELLMGLMKMQKQGWEGVEMDVAQSWLAEGVATYCATEPIGAIDEEWLFRYQEAEEKDRLNPVEFLTSFRMGSFTGLVNEAVLDSYAESWAFTSFLMDKYPDQFMGYQIKMITMKPKDSEEELEWLLQSIGKDLPELEKEFKDYMAAYPKAEDPFVKNYMRYYKIWEDLLKSG